MRANDRGMFLSIRQMPKFFLRVFDPMTDRNRIASEKARDPSRRRLLSRSAGLLGASVLLAFIRLVKGPTTSDRVVAADTLATNVLGVIALFAIQTHNKLFIIAVLALAILSFVGTTVYAKFLERGKIIE